MPFPTHRFIQDAGRARPEPCTCLQCAPPAQANLSTSSTPPKYPELLPETFPMSSSGAEGPITDREPYIFPDNQNLQAVAHGALPYRPRTPRPIIASESTHSWFSPPYSIRPPESPTIYARREEVRAENKVPGAFPIYATENAPFKDDQKQNIKSVLYPPIQDLDAHIFGSKADAKDLQKENKKPSSQTPLKDTPDRSYEQCIAVAAEVKAKYQKARNDAKAAAEKNRPKMHMEQIDETRQGLATELKSWKAETHEDFAKKMQVSGEKSEEVDQAAYKHKSQAAVMQAAMKAADQARANEDARKAKALEKERLRNRDAAWLQSEFPAKARAKWPFADIVKKAEDEWPIGNARTAGPRRRAEETNNAMDFEHTIMKFLNTEDKEAERAKKPTPKLVRFMDSEIQAVVNKIYEQEKTPLESVRLTDSERAVAYKVFEQLFPSTESAGSSQSSQQPNTNTTNTPDQAATSTKPHTPTHPQVNPINLPGASRLTKTADPKSQMEHKASISEHVEWENIPLADEADVEDWEEVQAEGPDREEWEIVGR